MESGASYNEQALLWKVIRFVWAVTYIRTAPRPPYWRGAGGPVRFYAPPYGGDGSYGK